MYRQRKARKTDDGVPLCAYSMACPNFRKYGYSLCEDHQKAAVSASREKPLRTRRDLCLGDPTRKGAASKLATSEEVLEFVSKPVSPTSKRPEYLHICRNIVNTDISLPIFYIDTEFANTLMCEIGILDSEGKTVVNNVIDYGDDYLALTNTLPRNIWVSSVLERYYGSESTAKPDITLVQLCARLEQLGFPNVQLLEWSTSRCDWHSLRRTLTYAGKEILLPPLANSILAIPMWRSLMPGFWTFSLRELFHMFFPQSALKVHHKADVDARKLFLMMQEFATIYLR